MARSKAEPIIRIDTDHEYVMRPLAGKGDNLEIALTYIRQVLPRMPAYEWQLCRAIAELEDAWEAFQEAQRRAVECWRIRFP